MENKYIEINDKSISLVSRLDSLMGQIEVRGESVSFLFNARLIIQELMGSAKTKEELFKEKEGQ